MAEIKVEKKTAPWWLWLLLALLVLGLVWWLVSALGDDDDVLTASEPGPAVAVAPAAPAAADAEIDDVLMIVTVPDRRPLVGSRIRLTNVPVLDVVGDRSFWIGPSREQRVFVVLDESGPPTGPTDADININPGQVVNLTGVVRAMPDARTAEAAFGAPGAAAVREESVYLFAQAAEVTAQP